VTQTPTSTAIEAWEAAYLRFETPEQEIRKFTTRLHAVGVAGWPREARVLEMFCGRGNGMVALERLGFHALHGVDLSPRLVRLYRGRGHCSAGDCRALPLRSSSQDVVIVQGGLHHLPDVMLDLPIVVGEVQRVLKRGGLFVAVEPWLTPFLRLAHAACESPARRLWGRLDALATMIEYERETYTRWLANPEFVRAQLIRSFEPRLHHERWGNLVFSGRNTHAASAVLR
jgi:SAM-dependent methyltransferase